MSEQQEPQEANDHHSASSHSGSGSASEASGIIQQMQNLVDVESGLSDAYLAVEAEAAAPASGSDNVDEIAVDDEEAEADTGAHESNDFMQAAEKVEDALESAIPPAPSSASGSATATATGPTLPGFGSSESTHAQAQPQTQPSSSAATEAQQAIDAVNADIPNPVLPEQVAEPVHDVVMETAIEEETSPMQVDQEEEEEEVRPRYDPSEPQEPIAYDPSEPQTSYDPSEPQTTYDPSEPQTTYDPSVPQTTYDPSEPQVTYDPSEPQEQDIARASYDPSEPQQLATEQAAVGQSTGIQQQNGQTIGQQNASDHYVPPAAGVDPRQPQQPLPVKQESNSNAGTPIQQNAPPAMPVPTLIPPPTGRPLCELPADITDQSPSVTSNRELVNLWRSNPSNTHALLGLFDWSVQRSEIADARAWYAVIAKDDPSAVQPLLSLIKLEQALDNFTRVEELFAKAIKGPSGGITATANVNVWKQYLQYIRRQNPVIDGAGAADPARNTISSAYDFALGQCGTDRASGEIWQDYIKFLQGPRPTNEWEEQQKQDSLRKTFHKAICIPHDQVEALWREYDTFEHSVNKQTAKKFTAERSPAYMTARTALKDLHRLTDMIPRPTLPPRPTFSAADRSMINQWKAYLTWEEGNPLVIEDKAALGTRVGYAMRQCVGEMRHFPELWHFVSNHYAQSGDIGEAISVLRAGIEACPGSVLLTFACADLLEAEKDYKTCHEIYESLTTNLSNEVEDLLKTVAAEVEIARGPEIPNAPQTGDDEIQMSEDVRKLVDEREARGKMVEERRAREVLDLESAISIVWVMYMRFSRRAEGIKAARSIFGKARRTQHLTWHLFEASAMMEFHSNKDAAVAIKIFDLGAKRFPNEVEYVIRHLQFLLSINDDTNARALFERSALNIPAEKARPLWDAWARYEYMYGDLAAVTKLEARFAEVFPRDSPLKRLAQRFTYNGVDQIGIRELGLGRIVPPPPAGPMQPPPMGTGMGLGMGHGFPPPMPMPPMAAPHAGPSASGQYNQNQNQHQNGNQNQNPYPRPPSPRSRSPPPIRRGRPSRSPSFNQGPPGNKRYRPSPSYNAPPPREREDNGPPPAPRNRYPSGGNGGIPPPFAAAPPPLPMSIPPRASPAPIPVAAPAAVQSGDPSGLAPALPWFIAKLPNNRSFDGPVFRSDDIMRLFDNIGPDGKGSQGAPPPHRAYPEAQRFPPPAMGARRY